MDDISSLWTEPEGFIFQQLVRIAVLQDPLWCGAPTLASLRLVSRAWRAGMSQALEVLAPRPAACTSDLLQLPAAFPGLKALKLQAPTQDGPTLDAVLAAVAQGCRGLRALAAYNCDALTAHGTASLGQLQSLNRLELEAPGPACQGALQAVAGTCAPQHLRLLPLTASWGGPQALELITHKLTVLQSLALSAAGTTATQIAAFSSLRSLSALALAYLAPAAAGGLAELAAACPALRSLRFDFQVGTPAAQLGDTNAAERQRQPVSLSSLLPLASLRGLTHLMVPWELFWGQAQGISHLVGLQGLEVDFHATVVSALLDEEEPQCDAICAALLRRLTSLQHLRLAGGGSELSSACLVELTNLGPSLTALDLDRCFNADNQVMAAVGQLPSLRLLRLASTCFDGEGTAELGRLSALTALTLNNSAGVMSTVELVEAVAQVKTLRRLQLRGHPYMNGAALGQMFSALPSLELLQTTWRQSPGSDVDAAVCQRWGRALQHSMNVARTDSSPEFLGPTGWGWPEHDGREVLRWTGVC